MARGSKHGGAGPGTALGVSTALIGLAFAGYVTVGPGDWPVIGGAPEPMSQEDTVALVPAPPPETGLEPGQEAEPEPEASAGPEAPPPAPLPELDVVRVAPDGGALFAGRAAPEAQIRILLDGATLTETLAGGSGDFVALTRIEPSDAPRSASILSILPDGTEVAGAETVLIAAFAAPSDTPVVAETADLPQGADVASAPALSGTPELPTDAGAVASAPAAPGAEPPPGETVDVQQDASGTTPAPAPQVATSEPVQTPLPEPIDAPASDLGAAPDTAALTPVAPTGPAIAIIGPEGARIVTEAGSAPDVQTDIQLDVISYDAEGTVILSGRATASADVQILLDNQPIQLGEVGPNGDWSLRLPDVDPGTYTLRLEERGPDGAVESSVETPFLREDPARVAEAAADAETDASSGARVEVITVQSGFTLWGIAEDRFGDGIQYVQIFEENRDQISDPNWIFPGQIFRLPNLPTTTPEN